MQEIDITVRGWLGSEVTLTETSAGPVASFRVATTPQRRTEGRWEDLPPVWFTVKAWRGLATNAAASLGQGHPVVVSGRFVAESWRRPDDTVAVRQVVVARALGHDLAWGTSAFQRTTRRVEAAPAATTVEEEARTQAPQSQRSSAA